MLKGTADGSLAQRHIELHVLGINLPMREEAK